MPNKRRSHKYGSIGAKRKKRDFVLKPGLRGFICTCNNREKDCIRESYNILNEYAENLYPGENDSSVTQPTVSEDDQDDLAKEIDSLKQEGKMRRFQVVESGAKNCLFIRTTLPDPIGLVHSIMKDAQNTKQQKGRYLMRLIPIEATCKAYMGDIEVAAAVLFDKYFSTGGKTFSIIINRHNSSALNRDELIELLADMIKFRNSDNRVDLKLPDLTVLVELIRSVCCLTVLPDYMKLQKYNLMELSSVIDKRSPSAKVITKKRDLFIHNGKQTVVVMQRKCSTEKEPQPLNVMGRQKQETEPGECSTEEEPQHPDSKDAQAEPEFTVETMISNEKYEENSKADGHMDDNEENVE